MVRAVYLLLPLGVLVSCSNGDADTAATTDTIEQAAARVWIHNEPESNDELDALISGEVQYDEVHDCLLVTAHGVTYPVAWPGGR